MPTRRRLAMRDWCSLRKRQDDTAPPNASCSKCSGPMQIDTGQRKRRSGLPKRLRFMMWSPRSIRANNPAPATAEIAARSHEARTTIEAVAAAVTTAAATIETAAAATAEAATTTTATAAATTLGLCCGAASSQHDRRGTNQTKAINRDKRRGCEAAGQEVTALRSRLSHSWDLPFCRSTALECFRCRIVQQSYSASNSSSRMLM